MVGLPGCLETVRIPRAIDWETEFAPQLIYSQADGKHFVRNKMSLLLGIRNAQLIAKGKVRSPWCRQAARHGRRHDADHGK